MKLFEHRQQLAVSFFSTVDEVNLCGTEKLTVSDASEKRSDKKIAGRQACNFVVKLRVKLQCSYRYSSHSVWLTIVIYYGTELSY